MVLNRIWISFFLIAFVIALVKFALFLCGMPEFGGETIFPIIVNSTFTMSKTAFEIALGLTGTFTLWMGLMKIGEKAGAIDFLSKMIGPFFRKLYPGIPKDHPAMGKVMLNYSANMLGLGNAATPMGIKAMESMQELNPDKEKASDSQIMFLTMNTACFTLVPVSIMAIRMQQGAQDATDVFVPILITTYCATLLGIIAVAVRQRILNTGLITWLVGISSVVALIIFGFASLGIEEKQKASTIAGNIILFGIIISFIGAGALKKINVFDAFIEGAKEGFNTVLKILPYLLAMLVAIGVFRASGAMEYLTDGLRWCFHTIGVNADFVDSLPVAMMKPLSGGGTQGLTIDAIKTFGVDSFTGRLSSIMYASADTTFYIVALYFGSVGIKNTRYAIQYGLLADLAGILAAIFVAYLFFH